MIITIDGHIATGKSTVAKKLAHQIGFIYFDTGAMYRALCYSLLTNHIPLDNKEVLNKFLETFLFDIKIHKGEKSYFVNDEDVTTKIRHPDITSNVSKISAIKEVRQALVSIQRNLSQGVNAIFEGRDMGTIVFPDAEVKVFLSGDPKIRAERRYEELKQKFPNETKNLTLDQTLASINQRDKSDSEREISPLKKADDALEIDTTTLTSDEVVGVILEYIDTLPSKMM